MSSLSYRSQADYFSCADPNVAAAQALRLLKMRARLCEPREQSGRHHPEAMEVDTACGIEPPPAVAGTSGTSCPGTIEADSYSGVGIYRSVNANGPDPKLADCGSVLKTGISCTLFVKLNLKE
jgi:hypothetical protein